MQQISGFKLKLTQAGANYVNRALKRKALKRFSQFGTLDVRLIKPPASGAGTAPGGHAGQRRPAAPRPSTPGLLGTAAGRRHDHAADPGRRRSTSTATASRTPA